MSRVVIAARPPPSPPLLTSPAGLRGACALACACVRVCGCGVVCVCVCVYKSVESEYSALPHPPFPDLLRFQNRALACPFASPALCLSKCKNAKPCRASQPAPIDNRGRECECPIAIGSPSPAPHACLFMAWSKWPSSIVHPLAVARAPPSAASSTRKSYTSSPACGRGLGIRGRILRCTTLPRDPRCPP